jgi:hypothetical protein
MSTTNAPRTRGAGAPSSWRYRAQRGAALVTTTIILTSMMIAAASSIYLLTTETRSAGYAASARRALFCAEAGLAAARDVVANNYATWGTALDADLNNDPSWYPIRGTVDGTSSGNDFEVTLRDNDDEMVPLANDLFLDSDLRVFVISRCVRYSEYPRTLTELVEYRAGGNAYRNQSGQGAANTGNAN